MKAEPTPAGSGCEALVDTSIHIKRLISKKWRESRNDEIWKHFTPVASTYTLMEFKNSVIGAIMYLVDVLTDASTSSRSNVDVARVRLGDIIQLLNLDTNLRERDRRVRIASAYAARILEEMDLSPIPVTIANLIEKLECEAGNLEDMWFYYFCRDGHAMNMRTAETVNCELGRSKSPLRSGRLGYTCQRFGLTCKVVQTIVSETWNSIHSAVESREIRIRSTRLREGIRAASDEIRTGHFSNEKSIGQKLCFPIGDTIIVNKARSEGIALVTADNDQCSMAKHLGLRCVFYNNGTDMFI